MLHLHATPKPLELCQDAILDFTNRGDTVLDPFLGSGTTLIAAHRWRRDDQHPSGRQSGVAFLDVLRAGPPWPSIDTVRW